MRAPGASLRSCPESERQGVNACLNGAARGLSLLPEYTQLWLVGLTSMPVLSIGCGLMSVVERITFSCELYFSFKVIYPSLLFA